MLRLRLRPRVHAVIAGGTIVAAGGCKSGGQDTETDTEGTDSDGDTDTTSDPTTTTMSPTTLSPTTVTPTTEPPIDMTPPQLVGVEFLDPQILRLTFTEALASVEQVNPKRFRLSVARYSPQYYYSTPQTGYYDVGLFNNDCDYYYGPCYSYDPVPADPIDVLPDAYNPAQAVILLSNPVFSRTCDVVEQVANPSPPGSRGGLLLHYAAGGNAEVTDLAGLPLGGIGVEWIKTTEDVMFVQYADFPEQNPFLPIPCPF